jgi:hypothetical protein
MVEDDDGQTPLLIVHCNTFVPIATEVTAEVSSVGVEILATPDTNVHKPVPMAGVFPANTVDVAQIV